MHTEISKGHEARLKIKAGIDKACDAVAPTLGAIGMSAIIDFPGLDPVVSDDGVTILKNLSFEDKYEDVGLKMLRKGATRTSVEAGDGTATTTVLTRAIVAEAFKEIEDSSKIQEVHARIKNGLEETLKLLSENKRDITEDDIEHIANISSLDPEVAKLIADVIKEVGIHGAVTVEKGSKIGYSSEIVKGARFHSGLISPFFITDPERQEAVLEECHIVLADRKLSTNEQIMSILNSIGTGKSILFIADDIDSIALGTLAQNAVNKIAFIAAVKNPYSASRAQDFLFDMAALTGGTVISESRGMKFDKVGKEVCGMAAKVIVGKEHTTIIGAYGNEALQERIKLIEEQIETTTSDYEKEMLKERLASLTGGIGVIRVGAYTDTDFHAKKYKFDNAINSTQAALQEGIVAGGGVALCDVASRHSDDIFRVALETPFKQQAHNAGINTFKYGKDSLGINFKTKEEVDMFDAGIVDPFKVQRLALESACAIAMNAIVAETIIVKQEEKK